MVKIEVNVNYRLLNLEGGTYLTLSKKDDVSIIGQKYRDKLNQVFMFEDSGRDKVYFIKCVETNQYLAVPTGQIVEGQQLKANFVPFEWCVVDEPNMAIAARIMPGTDSSLYIDLSGGSSEDGTAVILYPKTSYNQVWVLVKEQ